MQVFHSRDPSGCSARSNLPRSPTHILGLKHAEWKKLSMRCNRHTCINPSKCSRETALKKSHSNDGNILKWFSKQTTVEPCKRKTFLGFCTEGLLSDRGGTASSSSLSLTTFVLKQSVDRFSYCIHVLFSHITSHLRNGKKYIIPDWAECISQEIKCCSSLLSQTEWFIKLLSLSENMVNVQAHFSAK